MPLASSSAGGTGATNGGGGSTAPLSAVSRAGRNAHGGGVAPRARRVLAGQAQSVEALAGDVGGIDGRVAFLEGGVASVFRRTVFTLNIADVQALGATPGPAEVVLGTLPPGSHIVNAVTNLKQAFASDVVGYDLSAEITWRAEDSNATYDAVPFDATGKLAFSIGSDTVTPAQYGSFGTTGLNDTPFSAGANAHRWPYTPTLVLDLTASGAGTPNLEDFTNGVLEIVVLSVTML